ncbi:MAG: ferrous iron transporter B, partial [Oscillospiraceae bacterium]|nr:ferrous iron transporter B [Oscillospiraceae bacterium]
MEIKLALAGNPNCGKTTLFNALTGSNQRVGNWPGVTVEKKEGKWKSDKSVTVTDLPGIYSLSPYTLEEVVARSYLIEERPDAIVNLVDATNIERNLYLTTQLMELGIPVVVALNMMDVVRKKGDKIDSAKLAKRLGCEVVEVSALKGDGLSELMTRAAEAAKTGKAVEGREKFSAGVEAALAQIAAAAGPAIPQGSERWFSVKLLERDEKVLETVELSADARREIETVTAALEAEQDDDSESIITNERYGFIASAVADCVKKRRTGLSTSDRIDRVVTNRVLALPIFAAVMFLVYAIAMGSFSFSVGTKGTDWANDGLFGEGWFVPFTADTEAWEEASGAFEEASLIIEAYEAGETEAYAYDDESGETEAIPVNEEAYAEALLVEEPDPSAYGTWVPGIPVLVGNALGSAGCNEVVSSLVLDGIIGGVGAVLGFVPQMLVLFLLLAILEDVGYMSRVAFIMDRIFRRFGLSGKSFIPMLIATGCGVPGIMASRTIEQDRDRKMTIMTTGFIPCGAKMPIIALFAGALFGGSALVAVSAFFIGIAAVVTSGILLKKFKAFAGEPAPFVMELPAYHAPSVGGVLRAMWERGWSFIKRAGTVILLSSIVLWFLQSFGVVNGALGMVADNNDSLLAAVGSVIAVVFAPLGFGSWQGAVAVLTGLIAKEEVVGTLGVLYPGNLTAEIGLAFTGVTAYSFMIFNLLCAPCFAAMGAIKREMNNAKWTCAAIG